MEAEHNHNTLSVSNGTLLYPQNSPAPHQRAQPNAPNQSLRGAPGPRQGLGRLTNLQPDEIRQASSPPAKAAHAEAPALGDAGCLKMGFHIALPKIKPSDTCMEK